MLSRGSIVLRIARAQHDSLFFVNSDRAAINSPHGKLRARTIPVKFTLTDDEGTFVDTAYATLEISMISDDVTGEYEEVSSTSNADTGDVFRVSENQYIYNLSTKDLVEGTYLLRISLDDGQVFEVLISLR